MNWKIIEERKRNRWQLAYDRSSIANTIGRLSPECKGVEMYIKLSFTSAFGKNEQEFNISLKPNDKAHWYHECLNGDCTGSGFSLDNEIYSAVTLKQIKEGILSCEGKEDWKYIDHNGFSCCSKCKYQIVPQF